MILIVLGLASQGMGSFPGNMYCCRVHLRRRGGQVPREAWESKKGKRSRKKSEASNFVGPRQVDYRENCLLHGLLKRGGGGERKKSSFESQPP